VLIGRLRIIHALVFAAKGIPLPLLGSAAEWM
jgi:hypothetical protein